MWFGVLGRLEVCELNGNPVPVAGPVRRQLLAALLCRRGSLVTAATLVDDLWGPAAPRSAVGTLRTHMARLRDDLGRDRAGSLVRTEGDGYRLTIRPADLDATIFEQLVSDAETRADRAGAIAQLDQALALWRDDAYVEFGEASFAVGERIRLAELRSLARERRTDVALAAGMSAELVGDLEQRVRSEPYRERGWEQLALALYRADRQADALATCRRAGLILAEDLGVDPGPALRALEERLLRQDPELLVPASAPSPGPAVRLDRCPYLGLAGYDERDAALFVGRERLTSVLVSRLADQSIVVLTGASGVGKSSLVRAGLLPALRAGALPGSPAWRMDVHTPIEGGPDPSAERVPDLVVIDQAEELFTGMEVTRRDELVSRLLRYVGQRDGRVLLVLRSDFYPRLAEVDVLVPFAEKTAVLVGPMRADELRRAIVEPARVAGLTLEPDLIETIMDDVADQPEPLPLLSQAMVGTWERRAGTVLTLDGYRLAGGVAGAVEAAAERCYEQLDGPARRAARHLLVRMAVRGGTAWGSRALRPSDLDSDAAESEALAALVGARLVIASQERIEIAHDALFLHWPRLRDWLAERRLAADLLLHLGDAASAWRGSGRLDADLYRGPRLSAAMDWRAEHAEDLSPAEEEFLDASDRAAGGELAAARGQAEREARGRRNLRRAAVGLAATAVLALAGGVVALHERSTARAQTRRAEQAALTADSRRLAALSADAPDIATSSLLAVAAYRLQNSPDARGALLAADERNASALWRIGTQHRPQQVVVSPDGTLLATIDNRRDVDVYEVATRKRVAHFYAAAYQIKGFTADDKDIVTWGLANNEDDIGRLSLVDIATGQRVRVVTTQGDKSVEAAMTSDSRWVVNPMEAHRAGGQVIDVFDTRDWNAPPRQFLDRQRPIAVAAGGTALAVENADGSTEVRDLPSLGVIGQLGPVKGANLHPEEATLAVSGDGSYVSRVDPLDARSSIVYRFAGPQAAPRALPTQTQGVSAAAFSPDGTEVALGTEGGAVTVYRCSDGTQVAALAGQPAGVHGMAWGGRTSTGGLYTAGLDTQVVAWSIRAAPGGFTESGPVIPAPDRGEQFGHVVLGLTPVQGNAPESQVRAFLIDLHTGRRSLWPLGLSDGEYVNQWVSDFDGTRGLLSVEDSHGSNRIEIWDLTHDVPMGNLALPGKTAQFPIGLNAAISPDGTTAYSSLGASRMGVFDLPSGRLVRTFNVRFADPDSARVYALPWMFDPHGRLLFAGYDPNPTQGPPPPPLPGPVDSRPPNQRLGLLDVHTLKLVAQTGLGDINFPTAVSWSGDGKWLVIGTYEGTLAIDDAATLRLHTSAGVVAAGWVRTASFSPDGRTLVTGDTSGILAFYSVPDLQLLGRQLPIGILGTGGIFAWYNRAGHVEGYAPDLARAGSDVRRWFDLRADPASLVQEACHLAGADITRAQWRRYIGDRPYEHVCPGSP